ncbi:MAG TPA: HAD family phosphatase [Candidatus Hydrogenedentes bacterium]|nr:HAD family phosphatase [Candidatus Hydrogenedentota bacterium]HPC16044.1 HAD family phosphatase [Candidatus Hydrogenedentota bacterium]HRT19998.1 HAD family phosphatase [Candidatus Hydrogenedentota bacterium]HRT64676.1 HAD family phosphatase [Candidatus Hydrogenedentota bacterium]
MTSRILIPHIGVVSTASGVVPLETSSDGLFAAGRHGVVSVTATGDRKVEFIAFDRHTLACVRSSMGYPAYYPVHPVELRKPVKAVLMDLDGTSVRSESFWIWIIQLTVARLLGNPRFELEDADWPHVSGHSVSEHLQYCIEKYCPDKTVEEARRFYFEHTDRELQAIVQGRGRRDAFTPSPGLKPFLLALKARGIRIGLVTSGLYEKAWPEIVSAFQTLGMGDPAQFYDAIVTAGFAIRHGQPGTLGELSPKPHPWLYAETARVGLGLPFEERCHTVGIEDSGAGICAIRLAGFPAIGYGGGNIVESGARGLCQYYCKTFEEIMDIIF